MTGFFPLACVGGEAANPTQFLCVAGIGFVEQTGVELACWECHVFVLREKLLLPKADPQLWGFCSSVLLLTSLDYQ